MIVNERIISYIHSLEQSRGPFLDELRTYAEANRVPIIRREVESFLEVLLSIQRPETILELGTAIGYSAIFMGRCVCENSRIVTIENYEKRILSAKENIKKAGMEKKICLIEGDALEEMKKMRSETFDFIFIDAAKAQYIYFLQEAVRLLRTGAVLVADNVLQEGDLIESRYTVTRRDRTIHARMREYMYEVKNREDLVTTVVPIGDGMTVSVKR
ncbi:MAG: O-methyltransferase [Lachnospiraceae bacterium]|jgi:Predicted O-methyltransferase|nr:O-methyltransferase [Lachnospiraceae bacterium]MCI8826543.1 O-methyltransferase [Lachnospiraceae bacterium]MCI9369061.1 O-methyltransferase [Lachnospiraceae bacterium]